MAATDMLKAGLEEGCQVEIRDPDSEWAEQNWTDDYRGHLRHLRTISQTWTVEQIFDGGQVRLRHARGAAAAPVAPGGLTRTYPDAQKARRARFERLLENYPGDAGVPEESDTLERYCLVQRNEASNGDGSHAFVFGDTFEDAVWLAGGEIFDDWWPEAVFDLDTGARIEVHVSSPIITRSEDQGVMENVLERS